MDATLAKKLQLKPGQTLRVLHAPGGSRIWTWPADGGEPAAKRPPRRRSSS